MDNYIEVFGLKIYFYGLVYSVGFLLGYLFFLWIKKQKFSFIQSNDRLRNFFDKGIDDLFLAVILGVIIGGRLGHVLIYNLDYYIKNPVEIFYLWQGGMGFLGGVIGVILGILWIKRKYNLRFTDILIITDLILLVFPFILIFGRIANFLNQELYGKTVDQIGKLGLIFEKLHLVYVYEKIDNKLRVNTNFIESFLEGFVIFVINLFLFIKFYLKNKYKPGLITGVFLVLYGIFRFMVEFLRDYGNNEYILFLTKTQWFMIIFILVGVYFIFYNNYKIKLYEY